MNKPLVAMALATTLWLALPADGWATNRGGGPYGGGQMRPPGAGGQGVHVGARPGYPGYVVRPGYPGYGVRPGYPGYGVRPGYPGWRAGYWGPRVGVYYGGPVYWGGAWPYWGAWPLAAGAAYTYSYNVAPVVVQTAPQTQVFIEQGAEAAPAPARPEPTYWYYCTQPAGYFPYVKDCTQPWLKVIPAAPGEQPSVPRVAP